MEKLTAVKSRVSCTTSSY